MTPSTHQKMKFKGKKQKIRKDHGMAKKLKTESSEKAAETGDRSKENLFKSSTFITIEHLQNILKDQQESSLGLPTYCPIHHVL